MMIVVDCSYLLYRSYFAYPRLTYNGMHTGGFFGFAKTVMKLASDYSPDLIVCAFDLPEPTWRHKVADTYKAQRKPAEAAMVAQIPVIKEWCHLITPNCFEASEYEADDIISTVSRQYLANEGVEWAQNTNSDSDDLFAPAAEAATRSSRNPAREALIFSADRDLYQLLSLPGVKCIQTKKEAKKSVEFLFGMYEFQAAYGVHPSQWVDIKALVGDSSDNLEGVPGIGPKTAATIINEIGCLKHAFDALGLDSSSLRLLASPEYSKEKADAYLSAKPDIADKLRHYHDSILMTYRLATLHDVPGVVLKEEPADCTRGRELFVTYGFTSLVKEVDAMIARTSPPEPLL